MKNRHLALSLLLAAGCAKSTSTQVEAGYHPQRSTASTSSTDLARASSAADSDDAAVSRVVPVRPSDVADVADPGTSGKSAGSEVAAAPPTSDATLPSDAGNPGNPASIGVTAEVTDAAITARITRAILDDATVAQEATNVKVAASNGAVTLTGTVNGESSKERIESLAKRLAGNLRVDDQIEIAKEVVKASTDSDESPPDRAISEKVRQAILADGTVAMDAPTVIVVTANGVVTLTGSVSRPANKPRIETLARDVVGVMRVDNQLEVKEEATATTSEETPADRAISDRVRKAISDDTTVGSEAPTVKIQTDRGAVTLLGSVSSLTNKRRIEVLAVGVPGVTRVENKLELKTP